MAFIDRNPDTSIRGYYTARQHDGQEEIADNHPDVIAFLNPPIDPQDSKRKTRSEVSEMMIRSGIFIPLSLLLMKEWISQLRTDFPAQTAALTDEQIDAALANDASPYFNDEYASLKEKYIELQTAGDE